MFDELMWFVDEAITQYIPDHEDVDLALRMNVLLEFRTYLAKRQAECLWSSTMKLTVKKTHALALLAEWKEFPLMLTPPARLSITRITDEAHKQWM